MTVTYDPDLDEALPTAAPPAVRWTPGLPGSDSLTDLLRLTPRDRWLLDLLAEHQALTTDQIAGLAFDSTEAAHKRLRRLTDQAVLANFHILRVGDDARLHPGRVCWTVGWVGATYLAARNDEPIPWPGTAIGRMERLAVRPRLTYWLSVNGVFTGLIAHSRRTPGARLDTWWSGCL